MRTSRHSTFWHAAWWAPAAMVAPSCTWHWAPKSRPIRRQYLRAVVLGLPVAGPPLQILRKLVKLDPAAVRKQDKNGNLPLHLACRYGFESPVIRMLIEAYPDGLTIVNVQGSSPLQCFCARLGSTSTSSTSSRGINEEELAVQAVRREENEDLLRFLIQMRPAMLTRIDNAGFVPLQTALWSGLNEESILTILAGKDSQLSDPTSPAYNAFYTDRGLYLMNIRGELPIHVALERTKKVDFRIVELLNQWWNEETSTPTTTIPISSNSDPENEDTGVLSIPKNGVVGTQENPMMQLRARNDQALALHRAIMHQPDLIESILELYPGAVRVTNSHGRLPLHLLLLSSSVVMKSSRRALAENHDAAGAAPPAARTNGTMTATIVPTKKNDKLDLYALVKKFVDLFPDSLKHQDGTGRLPLHYTMLMDEPPNKPKDPPAAAAAAALPSNVPTTAAAPGAANPTSLANQESISPKSPLSQQQENPANDHQIAIVRYMVHEFPDSVVTSDSCGFLPFEIARNTDVIYESIRNNPMSLIQHFCNATAGATSSNSLFKSQRTKRRRKPALPTSSSWMDDVLVEEEPQKKRPTQMKPPPRNQSFGMVFVRPRDQDTASTPGINADEEEDSNGNNKVSKKRGTSLLAREVHRDLSTTVTKINKDAIMTLKRLSKRPKVLHNHEED